MSQKEISTKLILKGAESYRKGISDVTEDLVSLRRQIKKTAKAATQLTRALKKLDELREGGLF